MFLLLILMDVYVSGQRMFMFICYVYTIVCAYRNICTLVLYRCAFDEATYRCMYKQHTACNICTTLRTTRVDSASLSTSSIGDSFLKSCPMILPSLYCVLSLLSAAEINLSPEPQTVFLNHTGMFTCDVIDSEFTFWRVIGTSTSEKVDYEVDYSGHVSSTLTLKAIADYNGTTVQCVTGDVRGVPVLVESENVTLTIQGS